MDGCNCICHRNHLGNKEGVKRLILTTHEAIFVLIQPLIICFMVRSTLGKTFFLSLLLILLGSLKFLINFWNIFGCSPDKYFETKIRDSFWNLSPMGVIPLAENVGEQCGISHRLVEEYKNHTPPNRTRKQMKLLFSERSEGNNSISFAENAKNPK